MSVGVQRLREEPDGSARGRSTRARTRRSSIGRIEVDARRRRLQSESDTLKAERNTASASRSARRSGAAPGPTARRSKALRAPRPRPASGSRRSTRSSRPPRRSSRTCCSGSRTPPTPMSRSAARRRTSRSAPGASLARARRRRPTAPTWTRRPHWELGEALDIIDNARGAKIAGSGFPVYKGAGRASSAPDLAGSSTSTPRENGFTEVWPPAVVNTASARGTGQIPDKEDQMYVVTRDELYLVPTAEVPVTNLHRDEILEAAELPIRYAAYTPVLPARGGRRRQGHPGHPARPPVRQGRDGAVREARGQPGGARVDDGARGDPAAAARACRIASLLMSTRRARLRPAQEVRPRGLGAGRRSAGSRSARAPTSATTRRAGWRSATGPTQGAKPELVHTLNGSGLALPRIVAALLETYQQPDGSIAVPEVLRPYSARLPLARRRPDARRRSAAAA